MLKGEGQLGAGLRGLCMGESRRFQVMGSQLAGYGAKLALYALTHNSRPYLF